MSAVRGRIIGAMTAARDELRRLVEELPEDKVAAALVEVQRLTHRGVAATWPPAWFGSITSERADTSERVDEALSDNFGR